MATLANDKLKDRLISKGLWGDFVRLVDDMREKDGVSSLVASRRVLAQIDPDAVPLLKGRGRPIVGNMKNAKEANGADGVIGKMGGTKNSNKNNNGKGIGDVSKVKIPEYVITSDTFEGKTCSYISAVLWAYQKHRVVDISPNDAPSEIAWNIMLDMRASVSFKADIVSKLVNQWARQGEDESTKDWEGEKEYDDLTALEKFNSGAGSKR